MKGTPEYTAWLHLRRRCYTRNCPYFKDYGGRGITVCPRWDDFLNFLADMGPRPTPQYSVDRIDVNGDYEPGNCRWATSGQQARNRQKTQLLHYRGKAQIAADWADEFGISRGTLYSRLRNGSSLGRALETPVQNAGIRSVSRKEVQK